jgi:2-methylaconitate cis-trans-isomerase PrpF
MPAFPTIFVNAADIGYTGAELQDAINGDPRALAMFETIRAHGAVRMGLIDHVEQADSASTRRKSPSWRRPRRTRRRAASASRQAISTCWCARSRWASCTTR